VLEILLLYALGKNIAEKAENQGRGGALFVIILIVLWFLGEIVGAVIGVIVTGEPLYAYLFAILGAAVGAILAYTFLAVLPLIEGALSERPRPRRRRRRRPIRDREEEDREERRRRRKSEEEDEPYEDVEVIEEKKTGIQKEASADYEVVEDDEPRPRRPKSRGEPKRRRPREEP
jgi:MFS family permease